MLIVNVAILWLVWNVATARAQIRNVGHVESNMRQMTNAPWYYGGPALVVQRVDPKSGMVIRTWGAEEEDDAA
jgi:hypothetical protein